MKKRLLALMMAAVLTMGMSMTAFAEGQQPKDTTGKTYEQDKEEKGYDGTIEGHTFVAYQVFKGNYSEGVLSNIEWGDGVNYENIITKLKDKKYLENEKKYTAADVAEVIAKMGDYSDAAYDIADVVYENITSESYPITEKVAPGYYLIVDTTELDSEDGDTRNLALLEVTDGTFDIKVKNSTVSVEKKVQDKNDSDEEDSTNGIWQDSADYDVNDEIPFKLTGTIPSNYDQYKSFKYIFHDTEEKGLKFKEITKVYAINTEDNSEIDLKGKYETPTTTDDCTFEVSFDNLKDITDIKAGYKIVVEYISILTEEAVIGNVGNVNTVDLEYTNSFDGKGTGRTKPDSVIVFTYELDVNKVTGTLENYTDLDGAGFSLYKKYDTEPDNATKMSDEDFAKVKFTTETINNYYLVGTITSTKDKPIHKFMFERIDDGEYILVESQTPDGYNTCDPIVFVVNASHTSETEVTKDNRTTILGEFKFTSSSTITNKDGVMSTKVFNNKGAILPSTGGIGTTMFYVIGGILVIGAGVILFARKRMSVED